MMLLCSIFLNAEIPVEKANFSLTQSIDLNFNYKSPSIQGKETALSCPLVFLWGNYKIKLFKPDAFKGKFRKEALL